MSHLEKPETPSVPVDTLTREDIVNMVNNAQTAKIQALLQRIDDLAKLDKGKIEAIINGKTPTNPNQGNGGCGIGCW